MHIRDVRKPSDEEIGEINRLKEEADRRGWYIQSGNNISPDLGKPFGFYAIALTKEEHARIATRENEKFREMHERDKHDPSMRDVFEPCDELSFEVMREELTFSEGHDFESTAIKTAKRSLGEVLQQQRQQMSEI